MRAKHTLVDFFGPVVAAGLDDDADVPQMLNCCCYSFKVNRLFKGIAAYCYTN